MVDKKGSDEKSDFSEILEKVETSVTDRLLDEVKKSEIPLRINETVVGIIQRWRNYTKNLIMKNRSGQDYEIKNVPHFQLWVKDENGYVYTFSFKANGNTFDNFREYLLKLKQAKLDITKVKTLVSTTNGFEGRKFTLSQ